MADPPDDLDATPAGEHSVSYLTIADADARAAVDLGTLARAWSESTDAAKKGAALQRATVDLERFVSMKGWAGTRYYDRTPVRAWASGIPLASAPYVQPRLFPRSVDLDRDGTPMILPEIADATYRQAVYVFANADSIDAAAGRRARGMTSWSEQGVSGQLASDPGAGRYAPELEQILAEVVGGATVGWIVAY